MGTTVSPLSQGPAAPGSAPGDLRGERHQLTTMLSPQYLKGPALGCPTVPHVSVIFVAGQDRDGGARWPLNVSGECCRKHVPTCVVNVTTLAKSPSCDPPVTLPRLSSGRPCGSRQDRMSWPEPSVCAGPTPSPLQGRAAAIPPSF